MSGGRSLAGLDVRLKSESNAEHCTPQEDVVTLLLSETAAMGGEGGGGGGGGGGFSNPWTRLPA